MTAEVRTTGVISGLSSKLTRRARGVGGFQGVLGFHGVQDLSVVCPYQDVQTSGVDTYQGVLELSVVCVFQGVREEEVLPVFHVRQALPCLLQ